MPHWALPRSAVPVESVPIKLSRTMTPVAWRAGDQDADQVGGNDVAGADQRARASSWPRRPDCCRRTAVPAAVRPMMLFSIALPVASAPVT